jgi:cobalt-zinc-cadmium efflux system protein
VVVAGTAVAIGGPDWIDALVALPIAGLLVWTGGGLVRRTTRILLEGTPSDIDPGELSEVISGHRQVGDVHHLHVWSVDSTTVALSAHVVVDVETLHEAQLVAGELEGLLAGHGVAHATLAVECHPCGDDHPEGG